MAAFAVNSLAFAVRLAAYGGVGGGVGLDGDDVLALAALAEAGVGDAAAAGVTNENGVRKRFVA